MESVWCNRPASPEQRASDTKATRWCGASDVSTRINALRAWVEAEPASRLRNFGSSEKCLPGVMKTKEPENQVTLVTQTICLAKKCLDLIVDAFHAAVVDPVLPPCKNAALMAEESSGHLPHLADARFVGPSAPLVEERPHLAIGGLLPKQAQGFLEQVASEQGFI